MTQGPAVSSHSGGQQTSPWPVVTINVHAPQILGIYVAAPGLSWTITVTSGGQDVTQGCEASWTLSDANGPVDQATGVSCSGIYSVGLLLPGTYQIAVGVQLGSGNEAQTATVVNVG